MTLTPLHLQQQLSELRNAYLAQLPQKLAQLNETWAQLQTDWVAESAMSLHRQLHSLAGSGTTYGFPRITDEARSLESFIKPCVEDGTLLPENVFSIFKQKFENLHEAITHAMNTPLPPAGTTGDQEPSNHLASLSTEVKSLDILLADDDPITSALTTILLKRQGHTVRSASDGAEALSLFAEKEPDLVLLDVLMPVIDGYQTASRIREMTKGRFIPIIFLTALTSDDDLARCIEAGGDDFLSKPFTPAILKAKIMAMDRIRNLYTELERYKQRTEEEIALSSHIYHTMTNRNPEHVTRMDAWRSSVGHFSGDLLAYQFTPDWKLVVLLGDFTGHGLAAAIGIIPAADSFYALIAQNAPLAQIAGEINQKLHKMLPTGQYCAASLMSIDFSNHTVEFWIGGMPPALLFDSNRKCIGRIKSGNLPLGIVGDELFDGATETVALENGSVVLYSDGLNEASNPARELFGLERIIAAAESAASDTEILAAITDRVGAFRAGVAADDDTTVVVVRT